MLGGKNTPSLMRLFRACPYESLDVFYMNLCHEKISVSMKHLTQWNAKMLFAMHTTDEGCASWKRPGLVGVSSGFFLESFPLLTFWSSSPVANLVKLSTSLMLMYQFDCTSCSQGPCHLTYAGAVKSYSSNCFLILLETSILTCTLRALLLVLFLSF